MSLEKPLARIVLALLLASVLLLGCEGSLLAPCSDAPCADDGGVLAPEDGGDDDDGVVEEGPAPLDGAVDESDAGTEPLPPVEPPEEPPPPDEPPPAEEPPPAAPLPTCADVDARLLSDFGLVIRPGTLSFGGLAPTDLGCAGRIKVYRMFVAPFAHAGYRRRLDPTRPITLHLYRSSDPQPGRCSGYVPNANAIQIRDLRECLRSVGSEDDRNFRRIAMFLIHESGHVLANRNSGMRARFREAGLDELDPRCYDRGFLITYSLRSGVRPASESLAEAMALFIGRRKVGTLGTIDDFESQCPHTYEWVRRNVFE